ncbi:MULTISPECIES: hypothetical protein [Cyanophyceae]|uniref:Uncharacterized protein n=1 Tax=Leptolyngbya subtilissima DQ-A4 TaxID=2933933 RepID=A0ABV0KAH0_9CYAN|nr:hypothetical protein [Nodosilinea sp. FACHB-141]MBD2110885.1 hypothetical protein [Nodosilinea sp. FACHB-141]
MARKLNGDDLDAEGRHQQNCNMKEGVTPEGTFEDWGDFEKDYRQETQSDVKASTESEIEDYWSTLVSSGVEIKDD